MESVERILRVKDVISRVCLSRSSVYAAEKGPYQTTSRLPCAFRSVCGWYESEMQAWIRGAVSHGRLAHTIVRGGEMSSWVRLRETWRPGCCRSLCGTERRQSLPEVASGVRSDECGARKRGCQTGVNVRSVADRMDDESTQIGSVTKP